MARRKDRLDAIAASIREPGGAALALEADIADHSQATEAVERAVGELGRLDTVVNNADPGLLLRRLGQGPAPDPEDVVVYLI